MIDFNKKKAAVKAFARKNWLFHKVTTWLVALYAKGGLKVSKHSGTRLKVYNIGKGNSFTSGENCLIDRLGLKIQGNNNRIVIGDNVTVSYGCNFLILGNNCSIEIGDGTTISSDCQFEAQEEDTHILIGKECMFSNHIRIRTNDSHCIFDAKTGQRTNLPANVVVGDHVWVAAYASLLKGSVVGNGSVVGYRSVVTKQVPENCVAVGSPSKVVQEGIYWER